MSRRLISLEAASALTTEERRQALAQNYIFPMMGGDDGEADAGGGEGGIADAVANATSNALEGAETQETPETPETPEEAPVEEGEPEEEATGDEGEAEFDPDAVDSAIQRAVEIFEEGPDAPGYAKAEALLDRLDLLEPVEEEQPDEIEPEFADDDDSIEARVWRMEEAERKRAEAAQTEEQQRAAQEANQRFMSDMKSQFNDLDDDPKKWTDEQRAIGHLALQLDDVGKARAMFDKILEEKQDQWKKEYLKTKPDAKNPSNTSRNASHSKELPEDNREAYREITKNVLSTSVG